MPGTTTSTPKKLAPSKDVPAPAGRATKDKATAGGKQAHVQSKTDGTAKTHAAEKTTRGTDKTRVADKAHAPVKAQAPEKTRSPSRARTGEKVTDQKPHAAGKALAAEKSGVAVKTPPAEKAPAKSHSATKAHAGTKTHAADKPHADGHASTAKARGDGHAVADKAHAPAEKPAKSAVRHEPAHRKPAGDGYAADHKFLESQRKSLIAERDTYVEQAQSLRAEADSLVEEMEPGDIQFDEESGEGGTVTVDRERDLALSAQALVAVEEIDHALAKIDLGTYGICEGCGTLIPKNRLEALPYARLCIACKSGGLSRR